MTKAETIAQYYGWVKEVVNAIRGSNGKIDDVNMIRKALRTILFIYAIRVSAIQKLRCTLGNNLTLEGLIGSITTFELSKFDNFTPTIELNFKS